MKLDVKLEKRLWTVPALGLMLALGAVACGGSDTAALDSWAKKVCDSAQSPIAQSQTALADTGKVVPEEAPAELQQRLAADLGTLATTNQELADAISKAGAPKIDNGAKVQQAAVDELRKAAQGYLDVQQKLTALPNTERARFADGLRSVGDQVKRLAQQSTAALNQLQSGELGTAIAKQPGCKRTSTETSAETPGATPAGTESAPAAQSPSPSSSSSS